MARINPLLLMPPALLAGFVAFVAVGNFREGREDLPSARAGHPAPAVQLEPLADRTLLTDEMLRAGEVTLVNFWASWCPPCRAEHPLLNALAEEGVRVYGVNYRVTEEYNVARLSPLCRPLMLSLIGCLSNALTQHRVHHKEWQ